MNIGFEAVCTVIMSVDTDSDLIIGITGYTVIIRQKERELHGS